MEKHKVRKDKIVWETPELVQLGNSAKGEIPTPT